MGVVDNEEIIWFLLFSLTPDGGEEPTDVDWKMVNRFFDTFFCRPGQKIQLTWNEEFPKTMVKFEISRGNALMFEPNSKSHLSAEVFFQNFFYKLYVTS